MGTAYRRSSQALSALMILVGVALVVRTVAGGGGAIAFGLVFGILLTALGVGRIYLSKRMGGAA